MKSKLKRLCAIILASSMLIMTGCMEDLSTTESHVDEVASQVAEVIETTSPAVETTENTQDTEEVEPTEEDTNSEELPEQSEPENTDKALGIDYPRPSGDPPLKVGSKGEEVFWLQTAINKVMNANLSVDGDFGNGTASKVIEFQSRCGLSADGVVGATTIAMIVDILSGNKTLPEPPKVTTPPPTQPPATEPPPKVVEQPVQQQNSGTTYVLNTNTHKFHYPSCSSVGEMKEKNKSYYTGSRDEVIAMGYDPCKRCNP